MKGLKQLQRIAVVAGMAVLGLAGAAGARAEADSLVLQAVYLSAPGNGNVGGVAYADEDIVRYYPATQTWAMHFDGSVHGLPAAADIDAYAYSYNANTFTASHYMSFDKPVTIPGLGKMDDSDVVRYHTSLLGNSWSLRVDGSQLGLTAAGEDIDAISLVDDSGALWLSTSGNFDLINSFDTPQSGGDEDVLYWDANYNTILYVIPGSDLGIPAATDLHNLDSIWVNTSEEYLFLGLQKAANVGGVVAGNNDVVSWHRVSAQHSFELFWDASAKGFPKIDAFEAVFN
jgi:hypothetical protein